MNPRRAYREARIPPPERPHRSMFRHRSADRVVHRDPGGRNYELVGQIDGKEVPRDQVAKDYEGGQAQPGWNHPFPT
jgi:hypothetical protein